MGNEKWFRIRRAFTVVEVVAALGILGIAMVLAGQFGLWSLREREGAQARQAALETAANILEAARACPFPELDATWAAEVEKKTLPNDLFLPNAKASVLVKQDPSTPTKEVTVEIHWQAGPNVPFQNVKLVGFFSARESKATGVKP